MKRKSKKIILIAIIVIILAGAYYIFASFHGSIIKKIVTTEKVKNYVSETYPDAPLDVEFCRYDFKSSGYFCSVQSRESEDTHFIVWNGRNGMTDDYEQAVLKRENTMQRLSMALDDYTEDLFCRIYPHRTSLLICSTSDTVTEDDYRNMELDMPFDAKTFPISSTLTVWVETAGEEPTWEELAERFRELEAIVRDELPSVEFYTICLQNKYVEEDGEFKPVEYNSEVCAFDVPKEVITGNGLEDYLARVKAAQEAEKEAVEKGESNGK